MIRDIYGPTGPGPWSQASGTRADRHIGVRLSSRRKTLGLSLTEMAAGCRIPHARLAIYELGEKRVGAADLLVLARYLGVGISYFFAGLK